MIFYIFGILYNSHYFHNNSCYFYILVIFFILSQKACYYHSSHFYCCFFSISKNYSSLVISIISSNISFPISNLLFISLLYSN